MPVPETPQAQPNDLRQLVEEAQKLQFNLSVFCSHATAARVTLPRSLHDAAAALLLLPDQLRAEEPCRSR